MSVQKAQRLCGAQEAVESQAELVKLDFGLCLCTYPKGMSCRTDILSSESRCGCL